MARLKWRNRYDPYDKTLVCKLGQRSSLSGRKQLATRSYKCGISSSDCQQCISFKQCPTIGFLEKKCAYLRLKNVTLGYTLPKAWTNKMGLSNIRVYANGTNLLTFTDFKYIDPESTNVATGYYPQQRTFSFGIDVRF